MKITLLGTGTPAPSRRRAGSGYVVQIHNETFVFDHGPGAHARMIESNISITEVSQLFLTHFHYDHFVDVPSLILRRWDQGAGQIGDLTVYGPKPANHIFDSLFGRNGIFGGDLEARTRNEASVALYHARGGEGDRTRPTPQVIEVEDGATIEGPGWTVRAVETPHTQPQLTSLAYRLDCGEGSMVYSGDTGPCDALTRLADSADILIHMCHYVSGTEYNQVMTWGCAGHKLAAEHARNAMVKTLVLSHLTEQIDTDGTRERVLGDIAQIFNGRVIFGEDLKQITIEPSTVTDPL